MRCGQGRRTHLPGAGGLGLRPPAAPPQPPAARCSSQTRFLVTPPLQLVMSEITGSSPMALQAVKALALYMKQQKEAALEAAAGWLADPAAASNPTVLLVAGLLYALEEDYVEALRTCHTGGSMEM